MHRVLFAHIALCRKYRTAIPSYPMPDEVLSDIAENVGVFQFSDRHIQRAVAGGPGTTQRYLRGSLSYPRVIETYSVYEAHKGLPIYDQYKQFPRRSV